MNLPPLRPSAVGGRMLRRAGKAITAVEQRMRRWLPPSLQRTVPNTELTNDATSSAVSDKENAVDKTPIPRSKLAALTAASALRWTNLYSSTVLRENFDAAGHFIVRTYEKVLSSLACQPRLYYDRNEANSKLVETCRSLTSAFVPTPWMRSAHMQTIMGTLLRRRYPVPFEHELLRLSDGGQLLLEWEASCYKATRDHTPMRGVGGSEIAVDSASPILLVFPGLTGGSHSKYVRHLMVLSRQAGYRGVVFNYRGYGVPLATPMATTSVDVSDFGAVIDHLHQKYPKAPIFAVGFSMGANMLVKLLGLRAQEAASKGLTGPPVPIAGAVSVANAFCYNRLSENLRRFIPSLLYSRFLAFLIKRRMLSQPANQAVLRSIGKLNLQEAMSAQTIWDIDDRFTRHVYDLPDIREYYRVSSSLPYVPHVRTPLLCLNALDDPFCGPTPADFIAAAKSTAAAHLSRDDRARDSLTLPVSDCERNPNVILAVTDKGGHCGWETGFLPQRNSPWMLHVVMDYVHATLRLTGYQQRAPSPYGRVTTMYTPPTRT